MIVNTQLDTQSKQNEDGEEKNLSEAKKNPKAFTFRLHHFAGSYSYANISYPNVYPKNVYLIYDFQVCQTHAKGENIFLHEI